VALYYVAHRLFAAHDRALGAYIAHQLAHRAGAEAVFLPFCDTDEENLVSACKGRRLFELDCLRLRQITGMVAVLHGPSLDDGVCMEVGFAAALGVPVVIVTTDFQTYGPEHDQPGLASPSRCSNNSRSPWNESIAWGRDADLEVATGSAFSWIRTWIQSASRPHKPLAPCSAPVWRACLGHDPPRPTRALPSSSHLPTCLTICGPRPQTRSA
jgi:nucleoside 2-deoxyribosyltransferase